MLTRKEIEASYTVKDGVIHSPGKFEGEPIWVPYFYELMLNGEGIYRGEEDGEDAEEFDVESEDIEQFPELEGIKHVVIWNTDQGFVYSETATI